MYFPTGDWNYLLWCVIFLPIVPSSFQTSWCFTDFGYDCARERMSGNRSSRSSSPEILDQDAVMAEAGGPTGGADPPSSSTEEGASFSRLSVRQFFIVIARTLC